MICPPTRAAAITQLADFLPAAPLYARDRNKVVPGHASVSRLSPAIRHRLLTEDEVAMTILQKCAFSRVEKFIQEIYWRRYWKAWLSLRPQVWMDFRENLTLLAEDPSWDFASRIAAANSGNLVIDHFSRELVETGYLHNHARMWFAAWWIHEARLPWELGAEFFYRHLLDGDPASNTLSWRWVAGLQTRGKTYLARRLNLETYLAPELLETLSPGLPAFENPKALIPQAISNSAITAPQLSDSPWQDGEISGLWVHEDDLSPEHSLLAGYAFHGVIVIADKREWDDHHFSIAKRVWLTTALEDSAQRASRAWKCEAHVEHCVNLAEALITWAHSQPLSQIVTLRPEIGPLNDVLPSLMSKLKAAGIHLALVDRPRDLVLRPLATGGFFQFWEKMQNQELIPQPA